MIAVSESLTDLISMSASGAERQPRRVAQEFESIMMSELLRFGSKPTFGETPLDGGSAGRMAREQLFSQLATYAARSGGIGLASQLEADMTEASSGPDAHSLESNR